MDLKNWDWAQYKAAGRHVATYAAGCVTMAAVWGLVSQGDASTLMQGLNDISDGLAQVVKGITAIAGVLVPVYTAWRSAHSASPSEQIKSVAANLSASPAQQAANAVSDPGSRQVIIDAVAKMPEVQAVIAPPVAQQSGPKVVATPQEAAKLPTPKER